MELEEISVESSQQLWCCAGLRERTDQCSHRLISIEQSGTHPCCPRAPAPPVPGVGNLLSWGQGLCQPLWTRLAGALGKEGKSSCKELSAPFPLKGWRVPQHPAFLSDGTSLICTFFSSIPWLISVPKPDAISVGTSLSCHWHTTAAGTIKFTSHGLVSGTNCFSQ